LDFFQEDGFLGLPNEIFFSGFEGGFDVGGDFEVLGFADGGNSDDGLGVGHGYFGGWGGFSLAWGL